MKNSLIIIMIFSIAQVNGQVNCEAFKYYGEDLKYKACKTAEKRNGHYQFSRKYQKALDEALAIDSTFAYAYRVKSTAYLKSGDFITWKKLIDKAVKYDPKSELFYRASGRYQFFRDYKGTIEDIEYLDSLVDYDIGYSQNGDYHLNIIKALCLKSIGNPQRAIEIFEDQLQAKDYILGKYDHLHLGVLYLEQGNYEKAIENLQKQELENDLAENRFYLALAYKEIGQLNDCRDNLNLAMKKYKNEIKMFDTYVEKMDQIYLVDIENQLAKM